MNASLLHEMYFAKHFKTKGSVVSHNVTINKKFNLRQYNQFKLLNIISTLLEYRYVNNLLGNKVCIIMLSFKH